MEPFPWFEGYLINMDELYTELTLEKVEMKLLVEEREKLNRYREMFHCNQSNPNNRKILMKADPGMGKTTLGKKMASDWATGVFKDFSIIFFVSLKLVNPNDLIENAIILQNPELEGLGVSQQKLKALLNRFSDRILIILDGLDEHGLGQNGDVLKMIKNQKLLGCPILISSRPHSTWQIEKYFPTIVKVEGFTEQEAKKFVSNFFADENKIEQIMRFKPSDSREDFPVHKCPILLSILCFLVNKKEVDLSDTNITIGDLYFKMVKCLYKKYAIKKGIPYQESDLIEVMRSVGQLALRTLLSNNPLLQRSEVLKIAGEFALDYGFLAGDKAFSDLTADISVTFVHRSLEEFFGSFGFIQTLDDGKSVDDILDFDCDKPIFMVNPLVLRFCMWLLTEKCFNFSQDIYQKLVLFVAKQIDFHLLDTKAVEEVYPAMNIAEALRNKDSLKLIFFKDILEKCQCVHVLIIRHGESIYEHADGVLGLMSSNFLSKLTCLSITNSPPSIHRDPLTISIGPTDPETLNKVLNNLLPKYNLLKRNPQVYATVDSISCESLDLSTLMTKHIKQLHCFGFDDHSPPSLFVSGKFPHCPQLTHFILEGCNVDDSVPSALMKAVQQGKLPNLKRIELNFCKVSDCEWPSVPEFSFITDEMLDLKQMQTLSVLMLELLGTHNLQKVNYILKKGNLPNLSQLSITVLTEYTDSVRLQKFLNEFDPAQIAKLEKLTFQQFTISAVGLEILSEKLTSIRLTELDLSHSVGFTGNLSALFTHRFPRLNTLKLRWCKLNSNNVQSLARANVEGKLPQLRHLDISDIDYVKISDLFTHSAQWNQLKTLETSDKNILNVEPKCLISLEELILSSWCVRQSIPQSVTRQWLHLEVIGVEKENIACCIADGVERGMFPSLTTVRCNLFCYGRPFFFKLLKANISVEPTL